MQCPKCESNRVVKNGRRKDKQNYLCRNCDRQFIDTYDQRGYSQEVKEHCLTLYCNGMGFGGNRRFVRGSAASKKVSRQAGSRYFFIPFLGLIDK